MRLIDADELGICSIDHTDIPTDKGLMVYMADDIDKAPTIKSPIETLKELRAEIDREGDYYDTNVDQDMAKGLYKAVQIIDRKISTYKGVE